MQYFIHTHLDGGPNPANTPAETYRNQNEYGFFLTMMKYIKGTSPYMWTMQHTQNVNAYNTVTKYIVLMIDNNVIQNLYIFTQLNNPKFGWIIIKGFLQF